MRRHGYQVHEILYYVTICAFNHFLQCCCITCCSFLTKPLKHPSVHSSPLNTRRKASFSSSASNCIPPPVGWSSCIILEGAKTLEQHHFIFCKCFCIQFAFCATYSVCDIYMYIYIYIYIYIHLSHMQVVEGVQLIRQETLYEAVNQLLCTYIAMYICRKYISTSEGIYVSCVYA